MGSYKILSYKERKIREKETIRDLEEICNLDCISVEFDDDKPIYLCRFLTKRVECLYQSAYKDNNGVYRCEHIVPEEVTLN